MERKGDEEMYFIGIVPPDGYSQRVQAFQKKWMDRLGVEPHITLKAQGGLTEDKSWLKRVQDVSAQFEPFIVSLGSPRYFGGTILYLRVDSDPIYRLHQDIVETVGSTAEQVKQYFELDQYVPHLTLAKVAYGGNVSSGLTQEQLNEMEKAAEFELTPYPTFTVEFIRVYELREGSYVPLIDLPLKR